MKYKLDKSNTVNHYGQTLFAIVALSSFGDVKKGDVGGYIESESNLSQTGDGWVYRNARVMGKTVIHDGEFRGGVFLGGVFLGGEFRGGEFRGGVFLGGVFLGGVFRGGEFLGGEFRGGEFRGGVFRGGEFRGGVFLGGEFRGGVFLGGEFRGGEFRGGYLILQIQGSAHILNIPDGKNIRIGCQEHAPEYWLSDGLRIASENGYTDKQVEEYRQYIELAIGVIAKQPR